MISTSEAMSTSESICQLLIACENKGASLAVFAADGDGLPFILLGMELNDDAVEFTLSSGADKGCAMEVKILCSQVLSVLAASFETLKVSLQARSGDVFHFVALS